MVTLKIFLQKIGPHFIILYWFCGVDPVYLCILGGVVFIYMVEEWVREW